MGGVKLRKRVKRLKARVDKYLEHGAYPMSHNPGKQGGPTVGHEMHKPGGKR